MQTRHGVFRQLCDYQDHSKPPRHACERFKSTFRWGTAVLSETRLRKTMIKISFVPCRISSIQVTLSITVVSCSTHKQQFKQQLAPWSVTREVSTSDTSHWVEFLGPATRVAKGRRTTRRSGAEPGRVLVGTSTICTQDTWVRHAPRTTQVSVRCGTAAFGVNG